MGTRIKLPGINLPTGPTDMGREGSLLVAESKAMERQRRLEEQKGEMRFARVNAREHSEQEVSAGPEGDLQNDILQHPALDNPRFDGIDSPLNPDPPVNSGARREKDNAERTQEQEKQYRLGLTNAPKFSPRPRGPTQ